MPSEGKVLKIERFSIEGRRWVAGITFRGKLFVCVGYGDGMPVAVKIFGKCFGSMWARNTVDINVSQ